MKLLIRCCACLLLAVVLPACTSMQVGAGSTLEPPTVIFLVRHGEKPDPSIDDLSAAGQQRAELLATILRDAEIKSVHSTDYRRTRGTAAPTAMYNGLGILIYDPRDPQSLIDRLHRSGGRHLVVGHSNTTPDLVERLGGEPGPSITENEYDRLYIVTVATDGSVSSVLLRYGVNR